VSERIRGRRRHELAVLLSGNATGIGVVDIHVLVVDERAVIALAAVILRVRLVALIVRLLGRLGIGSGIGPGRMSAWCRWQSSG
jgi:hypothetical protein